MKKILTIGGSNSRNSINKKLAHYAASLLKKASVISVDLNDFDLPIYGIDEETENGIPADATTFNQLLEETDGVIISLAEHNGSYSAAFKNLYDWVSRIDQKVWKNKPMLLMATSPGGRGGQTVLATAEATFPRMGAQLVATFSLPSFSAHYKDGKIEEVKLREQLEQAVASFEAALK